MKTALITVLLQPLAPVVTEDQWLMANCTNLYSPVEQIADQYFVLSTFLGRERIYAYHRRDSGKESTPIYQPVQRGCDCSCKETPYLEVTFRELQPQNGGRNVQ